MSHNLTRNIRECAIAAAAGCRSPVNILCWDNPAGAAIASANPGTQIVIDHLGLKQPFEPPVQPGGFDNLDAVLALAAHDNVAIKITGAHIVDTAISLCRHLGAAGAHLQRIWAAPLLMGHGLDSRNLLLTYRQAVNAFRVTEHLSDSDAQRSWVGVLPRSIVESWSFGD